MQFLIIHFDLLKQNINFSYFMSLLANKLIKMQKPFQRYWRIGHTVFTSNIKKGEKRILLNKYEEKFSLSDWNLNSAENYECEDHAWSIIFMCIHETSCELLEVKYVDSPKLLRSICYPKYSKLMNLYLKQCNIRNIEFLTFLNADTMISLDLISNQINSTKPFNKLKWNNLSFIYLSDNPINEVQIHRTRIKSEFKMLKLDQNGDKWVIGRNINFVAKLSMNNYGKPMKFELNERARVKQQKVTQALKRKYPKINIKPVDISRGSEAHMIRHMKVNFPQHY